MPYVIRIQERAEQPAAVVRGHVTTEEIPAFVGAAFGETLAAMTAQHRVPAGPPFGRYRVVDGDGFDVEAGFPTSTAIIASGRVEPSALPGGTVATTVHTGSYDGVAEAYRAVEAWLEAEGYRITGAPWESYLDGPEVPEPRTEVNVPCVEVGEP